MTKLFFSFVVRVVVFCSCTAGACHGHAPAPNSKGKLMAIDIELLRLQYEILNVSADAIARQTGFPLDLIENEIKRSNWTPLWPDDDEPQLTYEEDEDVFTVSTDRYIDKTRKRLVAYSLAKEVLLATRYLELESSLIKKACETTELLDASSPAALKTLSALYRDLAKNGVSAGTSLQMGTDESGLPTVIVKDLSGQGGRSF